MYTTANGATSSPNATDATLVKITDYHPPVIGTSQERLDALLRRSERLVRDMAPPPDPVTAAYSEAARDTELAVFEHIFERPSHTAAESISGISTTYTSEEALERIIKDGMGSFVRASGGRGIRSERLMRG